MGGGGVTEAILTDGCEWGGILFTLLLTCGESQPEVTYEHTIRGAVPFYANEPLAIQPSSNSSSTAPVKMTGQVDFIHRITSSPLKVKVAP